MASDLSSNAAIWAALIAVALTAVLFLYALGLRIAHILHARRYRRLAETWWPIIAEAIEGNGLGDFDDLPVVKRGGSIDVLREWNRFRSLVQGNSTANLNLLARHLGMLSLARDRLKQNPVASKLLAIQTLGHLQDHKSWRSIEELLDHPNIAVSITAATALVNIDAERAMPLIIPLIGRNSRWPRTQVGRFLNIAGPAFVSRQLCMAIRNSPVEHAIRLLQFADSAYTSEINRLAGWLLKNRREPEVLSAALKVVRGHVDTKSIHVLTQHDAWYVRMQAASLLGRLGRREDYKILEPLLSDIDWWVRYRAAQSIVNLPFLGPNALRKLRERQRDRFARDILHHALAEKGLA